MTKHHMTKRFSRKAKTAAGAAAGLGLAAAVYGLAPIQANAADVIQGQEVSITNSRSEDIAVELLLTDRTVPFDGGGGRKCVEVPAGQNVLSAGPGGTFDDGNDFSFEAYLGKCGNDQFAQAFIDDPEFGVPIGVKSGTLGTGEMVAENGHITFDVFISGEGVSDRAAPDDPAIPGDPTSVGAPTPDTSASGVAPSP